MNELRKYVILAIVSVLFLLSFASHKTYAEDKDRPQPVQGLTVFDANGKRVGSVLGFGGTSELPTVAFRVDGRLVILNVGRNRFEQSGFTGDFTTGSFLYESANCVGAPFFVLLPPDTSSPFHILNGTKLYALAGAPKTIIVSSEGITTFTNSSCSPVSPFQAVARPLRLLIDLADHFQPPFTLR